ncbi:MAG: rhomboid family intramembrane serine protease [Pirellulaceae bacterium]
MFSSRLGSTRAPTCDCGKMGARSRGCFFCLTAGKRKHRALEDAVQRGEETRPAKVVQARPSAHCEASKRKGLGLHPHSWRAEKIGRRRPSRWIFGDNVEDRIGHVGYLIFYVVAGVAASASHLLSAPLSTVPTIGASGAIAGVMGAYLLLYPRAKVVSLLPIGFILPMIVLPAPVFLVIWFLLQLIQGVWSVTSVQTTGVAWWAHIGGFAFGFLVAAVLRAVGDRRPAAA